MKILAVFMAVAMCSTSVFASSNNDLLPPGDWMNQLPAVDDVIRLLPVGKDADDTSARQAAALHMLDDVIETFSGKGVMELNQLPPGVRTRYYEYDSAYNRIYRGAKAAVWRLSSSREFCEYALEKIMPSVRSMYWKARASRLDAMRNRVAANAPLNTVTPTKPVRAEAKPAASPNLAEPTAAMLTDVENARAHHVSLVAFGVPIGQAMNLPTCPPPADPFASPGLRAIPSAEPDGTCRAVASLLDAGTFGAVFSSAAGAAKGITTTAVRMTRAKRLGWLHPIVLPEVHMQGGIVVAASALTQGPLAEAEALKSLRHDYGPESRRKTKGMTQAQKDWFLPGLHVVYGENSLLVELESYWRERVKTAGDRWPIVSVTNAHARQGSGGPSSSPDDDGGVGRRARAEEQRIERLKDEVELQGREARGEDTGTDRVRLEQRQDNGN